MHQPNLPETNDERLAELESKIQQIVLTAGQPASSTAPMSGLKMLEDKLDSLNAWMQIEAKSRASMSALYDREFLRVGQDMYFTKKNVEALYASMPQHSTMLAEVPGTAEVSGTAKSGSDQINEVGTASVVLKSSSLRRGRNEPS